MSITAMKLALEALGWTDEWRPQGLKERAITALRTAIAEAKKQEAWKSSDTAYRPDGLPQDFTKHEVENEGDWSEWVCPDPTQYFMKCCDCGLVHEMQFNIVKYSEGDKCEDFDDPYVQAVFRARRTTPPAAQRTWVGLTDEEIIDVIHPLVMADMPDEATDYEIAKAIEAKLKEKHMTTHITKTWFDGGKVVTKEIPESEVYKQEPVAWMDAFGNVFPLGAQRGPKYLNEPMKPLYTTPAAAQRQPLTEEEIMQTWEGVIKYAPGEVRLKDFARAIEAAHGITGEKT